MPCSTTPRMGCMQSWPKGDPNLNWFILHISHPFGPTKIRQLVAASKLILKNIKNKKQQTKRIFSTDILLPFKNKQIQLWPKETHSGHWPSFICPTFSHSPFHSHGWRGTSLQSVQDFMVAVMLKTFRCKPTASSKAKNLRFDGFHGKCVCNKLISLQ